MLDTASKDPGQPLEPLEPLAESSYSFCVCADKRGSVDLSVLIPYEI